MGHSVSRELPRRACWECRRFCELSGQVTLPGRPRVPLGTLRRRLGFGRLFPKGSSEGPPGSPSAGHGPPRPGNAESDKAALVHCSLPSGK